METRGAFVLRDHPASTRCVGRLGGVLRLAAGERRSVLIVGLLGLAGAVFEGLGLSFLIPLARLVTGEPIDFDIPVIGPVLGWLDGYVALGTMHVVLLAIGFFVLGILVGYLNLVVSTFLAMRFAHDLRRRVFGTAMDRPLSQIESLPSGKFINNLASETWRVCDALFAVISVTVRLITVAVFFTFLMAIAPFYTLVLIAMTAVMALVVHLTTRQVRRMGAEAVAANEAFMAYVWDALGGLRVIRGFGREPHERARFAESSHAVRVIFTRMRLVSGLVGPITQIMTVTMVAVILGIAVMRGDGISTLIGFLAIAYRMQPRVASILGTRTHLRALEASIDAIEEAVADNAGAPRAGPMPWRAPFPGCGAPSCSRVSRHAIPTPSGRRCTTFPARSPSAR
jgi:ATP-binding cassette, subfamily B, bacterial MsbA